MSSLRFVDPKRVHRLLFGVYYQEDVFERFRGIAPAMRALGARVLGPARRRNLIFLHVPRTGGTSISHALYGSHRIEHYSARCLRAMAPQFWNTTQSFAVLRDPFDRFASSYAFVRGGGTQSCRLSEVFREQTAGIHSVDDYLSFLEDRPPMQLDFVMRPQAWFICEPESGLPMTKRLFLYRRDQAALLAYLKPFGIDSLPWLNRSVRIPLTLTGRQKRRVEAIYADDFALMDLLATPQMADAPDLSAVAIAAE